MGLSAGDQNKMLQRRSATRLALRAAATTGAPEMLQREGFVHIPNWDAARDERRVRHKSREQTGGKSRTGEGRSQEWTKAELVTTAAESGTGEG